MNNFKNPHQFHLHPLNAFQCSNLLKFKFKTIIPLIIENICHEAFRRDHITTLQHYNSSTRVIHASSAIKSHAKHSSTDIKCSSVCYMPVLC